MYIIALNLTFSPVCKKYGYSDHLNVMKSWNNWRGLHKNT